MLTKLLLANGRVAAVEAISRSRTAVSLCVHLQSETHASLARAFLVSTVLLP